ncbi:hypothetical protein BPTFM16_01117 [Altererythrobacter insulae]|nr:hypothetical protein BPTFM16_01117 [Altererythrobacter insulae]
MQTDDLAQVLAEKFAATKQEGIIRAECWLSEPQARSSVLLDELVSVMHKLSGTAALFDEHELGVAAQDAELSLKISAAGNSEDADVALTHFVRLAA